MGFAREERAIDGDALASTHFDGVAWLQNGDGCLGNGAVIHQMGGLGLQSHQGADGRGGAVLGTLLKQSACEHESDDHDGGVEPCVPLDAAGAPYLSPIKGVETAEEEADARREGYEGVHIGRAVQQLLPGIDEELSPTVEEVQQREDQHGLVGNGCSANLEPTHGDGHDEEGEAPGGGHLIPERTVSLSLDGLHIAVFIDHHLIANSADGLAHLLE